MSGQPQYSYVEQPEGFRCDDLQHRPRLNCISTLCLGILILADHRVLESFSFPVLQALLSVMLSESLLALWAGATLVVGKTPSGFTPASDTDLIVVYDQTVAMNGVEVDQAGTSTICAQQLPST